MKTILIQCLAIVLWACITVTILIALFPFVCVVAIVPVACGQVTLRDWWEECTYFFWGIVQMGYLDDH